MSENKMQLSENVLGKIRLFQSLPQDELHRLANTLNPIEIQTGDVLFKEGDSGNHLFIILEGEVEIVQALGSQDERVLAIRSQGEYVGEMSLFDLDHLRTASIRTSRGAHLLPVARSDFDELLNRYPRLAYDMVRVLSERLNGSHNNALQVLQKKNRELSKAYEDLKAAQAQLIEKEKLEQELQLARTIQMSILPEPLPDWPGFSIGTQFLPMAAVGGDFYDFIPLDENRLGVALGDVSGHGVPAALFMALTVALIRAFACTACSPQEVLQNVNNELLKINRESMFVTVLFGVLDATTHEFTYSRAGHDVPLKISPDGTVYEPEIGTGPFLGVFDHPAFSIQSLKFSAGDSLLLFTDGVTEAHNKDGEMFGNQRVKTSLKELSGFPSQKVCDGLLDRVITYNGDPVREDDITLVCLQAWQ